MNKIKTFQLIITSAIVLAISAYNFQERNTITSLRFINEYDIPSGFQFKETTVGGLSGIDYDEKEKLYYLISDDRSAVNPARFYTAKIFLTERGIDSVRFVDMQTMLQSNSKKAFPNAKTDIKNAPDPEAIRYNPALRKLIWTSEGERIIDPKKPVLKDPAITIMDLSGSHIESFPIPTNLVMQKEERGPRRNGTLEGLALSSDFQTVFISSELPLHEDGPEPDFTPNEALTRFYKFDWKSKKNVAQYAYKLDPVAYKPAEDNAFKVNGIPDILYLDKDNLLVIERSFTTGRLACTVKVFVADHSKADNIINIKSLKETPPLNLMNKKLILNMDDLGIYIDNIEGVTFGPDLPNGHRTLVFVADDNFNFFEKQQLLLFEVMP